MELRAEDLTINMFALALAICSKKFITPEQSFCILEEKKHILTNQDKEDMQTLLDTGVSYVEIARLYGRDVSSIHKLMHRYRKKKESQQMGVC